jgi:glycosyltransferase involved in cell wall biosynthesis
MAEIAITHDQIRTRGGAERVAFEMAREFDAPIYAARVDQDAVPDDVEAHSITDGRLGERAMRSHYMVQDLYQMLRWQHVEPLYDYDVVIQNKTNPYWFVPRDTQVLIRYCHSPPRGMFDQFHRQGAGLIGKSVKLAMRPLYSPTVPWADAWVCNSELVARRLERYWSVESAVIHPPVKTRRLSRDAGETGGEYLCLSRLRDHKRIDEAIAAVRGTDRQLVVAGEGPQRERLESGAAENVRFVGYVSEAEKARLLARARALIYPPENEDFGIVPIEAMAAGTPVIGVKDGFTKHQIIDGQNGRLFERGQLCDALEAFERNGVAWPESRIERFAERFDAERFRRQIRERVERAVTESRVTTEWGEPEAAVADGAER